MMQPTSISLQKRCLWIINSRIDPLFTNEGPLNVARNPEAQALISASQRREKVCPFVRERKLVHLNGKRKLFQSRPRVQHGHFPT